MIQIIPTIQRGRASITIQISHNLLHELEGRTFKVIKFNNLKLQTRNVTIEFEEKKSWWKIW